MAGGFFDLHVQLRLKSALTSAVQVEATWRSLFDSVQIPTSLVDEWRALLAPGDASKIEHQTAWNHQTPDVVQVVVQYLSQPAKHQPLGNSLGLDGTTEVKGMALDERVLIHAFAPHSELARALHHAVMQVMMLNAEWFMTAGYEGLEYEGGGDFQAAEGLLPQDMGIYTRTQRWSTTALTQIAGVALQQQGLLVASSDITVDGNVGGVGTAQ